MDTVQTENIEIWKQIGGSKRLFELYGYFPTFHDAKIERIQLDLETKEFLLTVAYSDFVGEKAAVVKSRITIVWIGLESAEFDWYAEDLMGIRFSKFGEFLKTNLETYAFGFCGQLTSRQVEIVEVELEPESSNVKKGVIKLIIG